MNKKILLVAGGFLFVVVGASMALLSNKGTVSGASSEITTPTQQASASFTSSEVSTHADQSSCWMSIEGNVYDITAFINGHPGGSRILAGCGKDATDLFNGAGGHFHSQAARAMLKRYQIGTLSN